MSLNHYPSSDHPEKQWWTQYQQQHSSMDSKPFLISQPLTTPTPHLWSSSTIPHHHHHHHHQAWLNNNPPPPHFHNSLSLNLNTLSPHDPVSHQFPGGRGGDDDDDDDSTTHNPNNRESQIMFEKPLTPSDVGKLNRLVIPKQHAEKYFPLNSSTSSGGESGNGMLLSFEDESGKLWRFRYSYWNSSQSYVLTKGWSRYVKEKRLDAGDVVLFERHLTHPDRLFIGWRRRVDASAAHHQDAPLGGGTDTGNSNPAPNIINSSSGEWARAFYSAHHPPYPSQPSPYQPDGLHAAAGTSGRNQTTPVGNSRRLRLFGVNMECQVVVDDDDDDQSSEQQATPPDDNTSSLSSSGHHYQHQFYPEFHAASRHNHTMEDIAIARDANRMRNRGGG